MTYTHTHTQTCPSLSICLSSQLRLIAVKATIATTTTTNKRTDIGKCYYCCHWIFNLAIWQPIVSIKNYGKLRYDSMKIPSKHQQDHSMKWQAFYLLDEVFKKIIKLKLKALKKALNTFHSFFSSRFLTWSSIKCQKRAFTKIPNSQDT